MNCYKLEDPLTSETLYLMGNKKSEALWQADIYAKRCPTSPQARLIRECRDSICLAPYKGVRAMQACHEGESYTFAVLHSSKLEFVTPNYQPRSAGERVNGAKQSARDATIHMARETTTRELQRRMNLPDAKTCDDGECSHWRDNALTCMKCGSTKQRNWIEYTKPQSLPDGGDWNPNYKAPDAQLPQIDPSLFSPKLLHMMSWNTTTLALIGWNEDRLRLLLGYTDQEIELLTPKERTK